MASRVPNYGNVGPQPLKKKMSDEEQIKAMLKKDRARRAAKAKSGKDTHKSKAIGLWDDPAESGDRDKYRTLKAANAGDTSANYSFNNNQQKGGAAYTAPQGETGADMAGNMMMSSNNPYAMAAGLGLKMMSSSAKHKRDIHNQRENNRYKAETERRQSTLNALKAAQAAANALG